MAKSVLSEWLRSTLELLVDDPTSIRLHELEGEQAKVFEVSVSRHDIGKVIGRNGKTADALRWVLYAIAGKEKKRAVLQIVDN